MNHIRRDCVNDCSEPKVDDSANAANGCFEPKTPNAAVRANDCYAQKADFAKSRRTSLIGASDIDLGSALVM